MKRNDMSTEHIPTVISACCTLHNLCEIHGEYFNDMWLSNASEYEQPISSLSSDSKSLLCLYSLLVTNAFLLNSYIHIIVIQIIEFNFEY